MTAEKVNRKCFRVSLLYIGRSRIEDRRDSSDQSTHVSPRLAVGESRVTCELQFGCPPSARPRDCHRLGLAASRRLTRHSHTTSLLAAPRRTPPTTLARDSTLHTRAPARQDAMPHGASTLFSREQLASCRLRAPCRHHYRAHGTDIVANTAAFASRPSCTLRISAHRGSPPASWRRRSRRPAH